jgi:phytoene dehydrogenase-like protein
VSKSPAYDAVVVGAGPNGLAAAIAIAREGRSVLVLEGAETVGGGSRSAELVEDGVIHDVCSAIHPLARASPFFRQLPLDRHGLNWIEPPIQLAHPLDDGSAVLVHRDVATTAAGLTDVHDRARYRWLMEPLAHDWATIVDALLGPPSPWKVLRRPLALARFGLPALLPGMTLARRFRSRGARALVAGSAAHSIQPLEYPGSAAFGLALLVSAHAAGWPMPRGGSQRIADALAAELRTLGGEIQTDQLVTSLDELPPHRALLLDLAPRDVLRLAGSRFTGPTGAAYRAQLRRYRYGPGSFKLDLVLDSPIPWRASGVDQAGTVHVGGSLEEIARHERAVARGRLTDRPFVLVAQPSLFDSSRAPSGRHVAWAYCHVPNGSNADMTDAIEGQIERFAPGFRERIIGSHTMTATQLEAYNPNYVGGDINAGMQHLPQLLTRPAVRLDPYSTPDPGIFVCSSATPPGGGVHGLCGFHAARSALGGILSR